MIKNVPGGKMIKIEIDGKVFEVSPMKNLLETCLALGLDIPHFCFHPALGSVGACRLCAVRKFKDADDKKGRIVMSCLEPVKEGLIVSIDDAEVKAFRAAVIESLMTNHPHDCPVCDEGGECHLQDMTVMTGHNYRRFDFKKRTYINQDLGPFINHEMNRCIQCYRCVRFYRDYACGKDLNVFASHSHVYFGRHEDGTLENEFSGNLVEVCPTGVFTDKTLKNHFTRKWDLSNAPSICVHCSVGCNILASERYGSLRRIMSRYNGAVNGYFICDRGRFGYEFVNDEKRIRKAKIRFQKDENQEDAGNEMLLPALETSFSKNRKIIGIGSPRASLESNFALSVLVGKENFYHGISGKEQLLTKTVLDFFQNSGVQTPSLKQIEKADAVIVLGEDLTNTAPMIALALRQASRNVPNSEAEKKGIPLWDDAPLREQVQDAKSPIYIATPYKDSLDNLAESTFRGSYADIAVLGFAIAASLDGKASDSINTDTAHQKLAEKIALALKNAKNPLIISGISSGDEDIVHAALNIAKATLSSGTRILLSMVLRECNSMGLAFIPGKSLDDVISLAASEEIDTLVILENDLYRRTAAETADHLFEKSRQIIVLDHLMNKTARHADILLPAATFAESEGTLVNNEGRAQRYYKAIVDMDQVRESWQWIDEFKKIKEQDKTISWSRFDDIVSDLVKALPVFSMVKEYMPGADFLMLNSKIPRQTIRSSGRTAINANIAVSEPKVAQDKDSPLAFSMEGEPERPPSSLVPFYWSPGWNSVQAMYYYLNEPNGSMKGGDPGIRLIEPGEAADNPYFKMGPSSNELQKDEWQIIPVYQIFGSEELSSAGSAIAQRIREPFIYMNQNDAEKICAEEGELIQLEITKVKIDLRVIIENSLHPGIAGVSIHLPGMPFLDLPGRGRFYKT
jgi:NADH-quinone oxidoreductase subunit G